MALRIYQVWMGGCPEEMVVCGYFTTRKQAEACATEVKRRQDIGDPDYPKAKVYLADYPLNIARWETGEDIY